MRQKAETGAYQLKLTVNIVQEIIAKKVEFTVAHSMQEDPKVHFSFILLFCSYLVRESDLQGLNDSCSSDQPRAPLLHSRKGDVGMVSAQ